MTKIIGLCFSVLAMACSFKGGFSTSLGGSGGSGKTMGTSSSAGTSSSGPGSDSRRRFDGEEFYEDTELGRDAPAREEHDRSYFERKVAPQIAAARAAYATHCGCDLNFVDDPSVTAFQVMQKVEMLADRVISGARDFCTNASNKATACRLKVLKVKQGPQGRDAVRFKDGKGIIWCGSSGCYAGWDEIRDRLPTR